MSQDEQSRNSFELHQQLEKLSNRQICDLLDSIDIRSGADNIIVTTAMFSLASKDAADYIHYACLLDKNSNLLQTNSLLRKVIVTDPNVIAQWLRTGSDHSESANVLATNLMRNLIVVNPELAITALPPSNSDDRGDILSKAFLAWGRKDANQAMIQAQNTLRGPELVVAVSAILQGAATSDPAQAFGLLEHTNVAVDKKVFSVILSNWIDRTPDEAVRAISKMQIASIQEFLEYQPKEISEIIRCQPQFGMGILGQLELTDATKAIFSSAAETLSEKDTVQAVGWLKGLPAGKFKDKILESVYSTWAFKEPQIAKNAILALQDDSRAVALRGLATALTNRDPKIASSMADEIPPIEHLPYLTCVLDAMAGRGPKAVAEIVSEPVFSSVLKAPEIQNRIELIASDYVSHSLNDAKTWVESLDDSRRPSAVAGFMTGWLKKDAIAATTWLQEMDAGNAKDAGIRALVAEIKLTDPESARQWEASLSKKNEK